MDIREIYSKLGNIYENKINKDKFKKELPNEKIKEKMKSAINEYELLYSNLRDSRTMMIRDYEYLKLLKEKLNVVKNNLINLKYEIIYDLYNNSEETKELYVKTEEEHNQLNILYVDMLKKIKEKETSRSKKINDLMFEIENKLREYKYTDISDIDIRKEIYTKYCLLNKKLLIERKINFDLFEDTNHLRFNIDYRPYDEYKFNDENYDEKYNENEYENENNSTTGSLKEIEDIEENIPDDEYD
jgi:hypothetical protein